MEHERILDKIKKCLALSKSCNEHEAAIALRQARSLMEKHGYCDQDILAMDAADACAKAGAGKKPAMWESSLALLVSRAFGCRVIFVAQWYEAGDWQFIGCGEAAEIASYAFTVLLRQAKSSRATYIKDKLFRCKGTTKTRRADLFCEAWVQSVSSKVQTFSTSAKQRAAIDAYIAKRHDSLGSLVPINRNVGKKLGERDLLDVWAGRCAGSEVYLHHGVSSQPAAALIGEAG